MRIAHYVAWSSKSKPSHLFACVKPNSIHPFADQDDLGRTILHLAAQRGNVAVLQNILDLPCGIDVNSRDKDGQTAVHYAAESKRVDAIALLVSRGADIHAKDYKGRTAMHRAAAKNRPLAIDYIAKLAGNDSINDVDNDGNTPARLAHTYSAGAAVRYLGELTGVEPFSHSGVSHEPSATVHLDSQGVLTLKIPLHSTLLLSVCLSIGIITTLHLAYGFISILGVDVSKLQN